MYELVENMCIKKRWPMKTHRQGSNKNWFEIIPGSQLKKPLKHNPCFLFQIKSLPGIWGIMLIEPVDGIYCENILSGLSLSFINSSFTANQEIKKLTENCLSAWEGKVSEHWVVSMTCRCCTVGISTVEMYMVLKTTGKMKGVLSLQQKLIKTDQKTGRDLLILI